jgi:uncharacterized membrane protein
MLKTVWQAFLVAIIAFVVAVFVLPAWHSYKQQHQTHHETSTEKSEKEKDSPATAEQANDAIVGYTYWLMVFTGVLAFVAIIQIGFLTSADRISTRTAAAAEKAANVAKDTLIAARRPWIMVDVSIDAAEFDQGALRLTVKFTFTNKGADPALYVIPAFDIVSMAAEEHNDPKFSPIGFVKRSLEKLCGEFKDRQNRGGPNNGGFTVFPDQPRTISITTAMPPDKVAAANLFEWMSDPSKNPGNEPVPHVISPIVLGCVDYEFGTPREDHQTWFAYQLPPINIAAGAIPDGLLHLQPMLFDRDAFYAD